MKTHVLLGLLLYIHCFGVFTCHVRIHIFSKIEEKTLCFLILPVDKALVPSWTSFLQFLVPLAKIRWSLKMMLKQGNYQKWSTKYSGWLRISWQQNVNILLNHSEFFTSVSKIIMNQSWRKGDKRESKETACYFFSSLWTSQKCYSNCIVVTFWGIKH